MEGLSWVADVLASYRGDDRRAHIYVRSDGPGLSLTRDQLREQVARRAGALAERGVVAGDHVGLLAGEADAFMPTFLALLWLGGVAVPLPPPPSLGRRDAWRAGVEGSLAQARPRLLCGSAASLRALSQLAAEVPLVAIEELSGVPPHPAPVWLSWDEPAYLQFTSGSVVSSPLLAAIAEVSAHALDSLRLDRALVGDLGFDSLMLVELEEHLTRTYPDLGRLPDNLMRQTTTIADLDAWLARHQDARPGRHLDVRPGVTATGAPDGPAEAAPAADSQESPRNTDGTDPFPEVAALAERLLLAERLGIPNPYFVAHEGPLGATTRVGGTVLLDFSGFDYLGLASHPAVVAAATEAIARYGTSVSASRVASGERPLHRELEASIAELLGAEAALTLVSGHATNLGVIGQLLRRGDLALHDELTHDSIMQGIRLSGARRQPFPHNDLVALDRLLRELAP